MEIDIHFQEQLLGVEKPTLKMDKFYYYINENISMINYDYHLKVVFSNLELNKDNLVSLFVNEPCDQPTVLPNIIQILETFEIHSEELRVLQNCNFSLKVSKSYMNEYEEIKELISSFCKQDTSSKQKTRSPVKGRFKQRVSKTKKNLSQSVEFLDSFELNNLQYNLDRLLPPEKRFAKANSQISERRPNKKGFPGSKGPTLKRPLGVFSQMRKKALLHTGSIKKKTFHRRCGKTKNTEDFQMIEEYKKAKDGDTDLSGANRSMLRRIDCAPETPSQKTKDWLLGNSGSFSQKSLTVKQTYSEKKFNDFLARNKFNANPSESSFNQSARFTKKAKKSFCIKTIHSKFNSGLEKQIKKTFSLRSLHTKAFRLEASEPSVIPLDPNNLKELTCSFVQRQSDRKKSFITVPHGNVEKESITMSQYSPEIGNEKSVQSLQTKPYKWRPHSQGVRSEEEIWGDRGQRQDTEFLKDLELLKDLDQEIYLNFMEQHLDYYEFLDARESMALIGLNFAKKNYNIDKINLRYRKNEHYYLPRLLANPEGSEKSSFLPKRSAKPKSQSNRTKKLSPHISKKKNFEVSLKRESLLIGERSGLEFSHPGSLSLKGKKKEHKVNENKSRKNQKKIMMPQDNKPMKNSIITSNYLKDSDAKQGSMVKDKLLKNQDTLKIVQNSFKVESEKVLVVEGLQGIINTQQVEGNANKEIQVKGNQMEKTKEKHKGKFKEKVKGKGKEKIANLNSSNVGKLESKTEVVNERKEFKEELLETKPAQPVIVKKEKRRRRKRRRKDKKNNLTKTTKEIQITGDTHNQTNNNEFQTTIAENPENLNSLFPKKEPSKFQFDKTIPHNQNNDAKDRKILPKQNPSKSKIIKKLNNPREAPQALNISEKQIDKLILLSEKSIKREELPKSPQQKQAPQKKRKRKRGKKRKKKKRIVEPTQSPNSVSKPSLIENNDSDFPLKTVRQKIIRGFGEQKILQIFSEFKNLEHVSEAERKRIIRQKLEEFSRGAKPLSPDDTDLGTGCSREERLLSLLTIGQDSSAQDRSESKEDTIGLIQSVSRRDRMFDRESKNISEKKLNQRRTRRGRMPRENTDEELSRTTFQSKKESRGQSFFKSLSNNFQNKVTTKEPKQIVSKELISAKLAKAKTELSTDPDQITLQKRKESRRVYNRSFLYAPFFMNSELDLGLLSEFMDEIDDREKFDQADHIFLENSQKSHKFVIIDPDLR